jgi:hypothetical protein
MFIPPMLCTTLRDPSRLGDSRYVAEPKFDGQRAQVHVAVSAPLRPIAGPVSPSSPTRGWGGCVRRWGRRTLRFVNGRSEEVL